ncbi:MAG: hypothetical protein LBP92_11290 [Deltaproteobacteria bacterium]|jgi:hypothetical protein|nr:hypothetical protein [Deltaproteobacteria bacterium]
MMPLPESRQDQAPEGYTCWNSVDDDDALGPADKALILIMNAFALARNEIERLVGPAGDPASDILTGLIDSFRVRQGPGGLMTSWLTRDGAFATRPGAWTWAERELENALRWNAEHPELRAKGIQLRDEALALIREEEARDDAA